MKKIVVILSVLLIFSLALNIVAIYIMGKAGLIHFSEGELEQVQVENSQQAVEDNQQELYFKDQYLANAQLIRLCFDYDVQSGSFSAQKGWYQISLNESLALFRYQCYVDTNEYIVEADFSTVIYKEIENLILEGLKTGDLKPYDYQYDQTGKILYEPVPCAIVIYRYDQFGGTTILRSSSDMSTYIQRFNELRQSAES